MLPRSTCKMKILFIAISLFTGSAIGQSVILPPNNATAVKGHNAEFQCELELSLEKAMMWEFNGEVVYNTQFGEEDYPKPNSKEKYNATQVGHMFTLRIFNLTYEDGGKYMCSMRTVSAAANLIVIGTPEIMQYPPKAKEGTITLYTCEAKFGGPGKLHTSTDHYPQLKMSLNGVPLDGTAYEKEPTQGEPYFFLQQEHSMTLDTSMDGKDITCEIKTSHPKASLIGRTKVYVVYAVRTIDFEPKQEEYEFGQVINCTADGNPQPSFEWSDINNSENRITTSTLEVIEQMAGSNEWVCTATNTIDGALHKKNVTVSFNAAPAAIGDNNVDTWIIVVAVVVPVVVIVGLAVVVLCIFKFRKTPKEGGQKPSKPDENQTGGGHESLPMLSQSSNDNQTEGRGERQIEIISSTQAKEEPIITKGLVSGRVSGFEEQSDPFLKKHAYKPERSMGTRTENKETSTVKFQDKDKSISLQDETKHKKEKSPDNSSETEQENSSSVADRVSAFENKSDPFLKRHVYKPKASTDTKTHK